MRTSHRAGESVLTSGHTAAENAKCVKIVQYLVHAKEIWSLRLEAWSPSDSAMENLGKGARRFGARKYDAPQKEAETRMAPKGQVLRWHFLDTNALMDGTRRKSERHDPRQAKFLEASSDNQQGLTPDFYLAWFDHTLLCQHGQNKQWVDFSHAGSSITDDLPVSNVF